MKPKNLYVLFGGASNERLVSTASAQNILLNLPSAQAWFLAPDGAVFACSRESVLNHQNPFKSEFKPQSPSPRFKKIEEALREPETQNSVVILALHGQGVEDGTLQKKMEAAGVAYTGSSSSASALAFDKLASKKIATQLKIRTARYEELRTIDEDQVRITLQKCVERFQQIAVKPIADGSSMGLYILNGKSNLATAADAISKDGRAYMIEEFISGTELTVGVVGDGANACALPPSEVRLNTGSNFDYDAKYFGKGAEELTPARVSDDVTAAAQDVALKMHRALGCEGYSRSDLIVTPEGPVFLETNTLPGMTKASFFPQQLAAIKSTVQEFFENEIQRAWKRCKG